MIADVVGNMPVEHRCFLMSIKRGQPDWPLLALAGAEMLPAVRWRLENLERLGQKKRSMVVGRLGGILGLPD